MKKTENSFYKEISEFLKNDKINDINNYIKKNLWITPLIYIIGTIALLIRNKRYGLQFTTISLLQFALIVVYLIGFLKVYSLIEYNFIKLFEVWKKKEKHKIKMTIKHLFFYSIYFGFIFCIMFLLTDNYKIALKLCISYYLFYPIFIVHLSNPDKISNIIIIIFFITLIMEIPISLGGFKGKDVIFHDYNTNKEEKYIYYGNYDDLYQFTTGNKVILIPIDNGYIEYTN